MIIDELRRDPEYILRNQYFFLDYNIRHYGIEGGTVLLSPNDDSIPNLTRINIVPLTPSLDGDDLFFPYVNQGAGFVVANRLFEGMIVITSQMNGCALDVRYKEGKYVFYHDANGRNMPSNPSPGRQLCRIEDNYYWGDELTDVTRGCTMGVVQFVCVYSRGFWHVGAFGFAITQKDRSTHIVNIVKKVPLKHGNTYIGCFNDSRRLICLS